MSKNSKYIIIFSRQGTEVNFLGFSLMEAKKASQYMKAVNDLAEEGCVVSICDNIEDITYDANDFIKIKVNSSDLLLLQKLFDVEEDEVPIGIFPNAITDAYDNGLIDEDEEYDDYD